MRRPNPQTTTTPVFVGSGGAFQPPLHPHIGGRNMRKAPTRPPLFSRAPWPTPGGIGRSVRRRPEPKLWAEPTTIRPPTESGPNTAEVGLQTPEPPFPDNRNNAILLELLLDAQAVRHLEDLDHDMRRARIRARLQVHAMVDEAGHVALVDAFDRREPREQHLLAALRLALHALAAAFRFASAFANAMETAKRSLPRRTLPHERACDDLAKNSCRRSVPHA